MYCVKCGVELQKGAQKCPLCGLPVYHPEIIEPADPPPYPPRVHESETVSRSGLMFILTVVFAVPLLVCLLIDFRLNGGIGWSGYVAGGLLFGYVSFCLPFWFRRPNPVIFYPCALASLLLLTLYVCLKTGGDWFLPFAFPVGGAVILFGETIIALLRYTVGARRHRQLYILGGAVMGLGALCVLIEFLIKVAFSVPMRWWSLYPLVAAILVGGMLLVIAICPPLRRSLHKKFFI